MSGHTSGQALQEGTERYQFQECRVTRKSEVFLLGSGTSKVTGATGTGNPPFLVVTYIIKT